VTPSFRFWDRPRRGNAGFDAVGPTSAEFFVVGGASSLYCADVRILYANWQVNS
jgi:hypothetical protein